MVHCVGLGGRPFVDWPTVLLQCEAFKVSIPRVNNHLLCDSRKDRLRLMLDATGNKVVLDGLTRGNKVDLALIQSLVRSLLRFVPGGRYV